jgi:hypothetical protein
MHAHRFISRARRNLSRLTRRQKITLAVATPFVYAATVGALWGLSALAEAIVR